MTQLALFGSVDVPEYVYMGDRLTDPLLRGLPVNAVRDARGKCVRGKNGNMLVEAVDGRRFVVLGRQLAKRKVRDADIHD